VIDIETALFQQFLNIAQRERIAKIPPYRTNYGLRPFEDRGSGHHFAILSHHQPAALKVATHPFSSIWLLRRTFQTRLKKSRNRELSALIFR
jgi:hypothetical protein